MKFIHEKRHEQAGETVRVTIDSPDHGEKTHDFVIEDWWDRLGGGSWMFANGNPACLHYAMRSAVKGLPTDDDVVYGKIGAFGTLIHSSEIE